MHIRRSNSVKMIHHDRPGVPERRFEICRGFIHAMHNQVLAWHTCRNRDGDFTLAGTIHPQVMLLCPLGDLPDRDTPCRHRAIPLLAG